MGDKNKTQYRFELWHEILKDIIQGKAEARTFDPQLRRALFASNPVCAICNQAIHSVDDAQVDHIQPFAKGGATTTENAQLAHRFCNQKKGSKQG